MLSLRRAFCLCLSVAVAIALLSCGRHDAGPTPAGATDTSLHPTLAPELTISSLAVAPDGVVWYSYDRFDDIGGSPPNTPNGILYRAQAGQILQLEIPRTIRELKIALDGDLYVAAGCGLTRLRDGAWESLAEVDCAGSSFSGPMVSFDIAFALDGSVWLAGIYNLARFDGEGWTEYGVNARRLAVSPDGSLWAEGWDGRAESDCCFVHVSVTRVVTYVHAAVLPVPASELLQIRGLLEQ